jgi:hypothetical protein
VLSVIVTVAVRDPVAVGAKLQPAVQLCPFCRLAGQPQVWGKSAVGDDTAILLIVAPLVFVMVIVCEALVVPSNCFPKASDVTERVRGGGPPVPLSAAVWGLLASVSATVNTPLRAPVVVGANMTLMLQDPPGGTLRPALQLVDAAMLKSPLAETLVIVISALWPLVSFTGWVALVPTVWVPKFRLLGFKLTTPFDAGAFWLSPKRAPDQRRMARGSTFE